MKALKIIGTVLVGLITLVLVLGLVAPKTVSTEQSIVINAPPNIVFPYLQYHAQQQTWSPWNELDPDMKHEIIGTDGTVGAIYKWAGNKEVGVGEQEITKIVPNELVETHLRFKGQGEADAYLALTEVAGGSKVAWGFSTTTPFPMNAMNLFFDIAGMVGKDYQKGLNKLKTMIETNKTYRGYTIQMMDMPVKHFFAFRETISMDDLSAGYAKHLPRVFEAAQKAGAEIVGMPTGLYFLWDEENRRTEIGYAAQVAAPLKVNGFELISVPAGKLLSIDYYGAYDDIGNAHYAMDEYVNANQLELLSPVWEEYVVDPQTEPDTSRWLTRVCYPVKIK